MGPFLDYINLASSDSGVGTLAPLLRMRSVIAKTGMASHRTGLSPRIDWSMFSSFDDYAAFIKSRVPAPCARLRRDDGSRDLIWTNRILRR